MTAAPGASAMRYVPALDGLRGISIILVVLCHTLSMSSGGIGVDVFFVLSGFLITRLFVIERQNTGTISLVNFFIRRALRLVPALWLMIAVMLIVFYFVHQRVQFAADIDNGGIALAYLTNFTLAFGDQFHHNVFGHTWSLGIEEQFYIFWAFSILLVLRVQKTSTRFAIVTTVIFVLYAWCLLLIAGGAPSNRLQGGFDSKADELLSGCLGAFLVSERRVKEWLERCFVAARLIGVAALFALCLTLFFIDFSSNDYFSIGGPITIILSMSMILDVILNHDGMLDHMLSWQPLVYIGSISYGIYLWHDPLNWLVIGSALDPSAAAHLAIGAGGGVAVASLSSRFVEKPILSLKHALQFGPRAGGPQARLASGESIE